MKNLRCTKAYQGLLVVSPKEQHVDAFCTNDVSSPEKFAKLWFYYQTICTFNELIDMKFIRRKLD